ncbi:MAG: RluA family pseudouridine synthase [Chlorobi bacterium]|nr:RluA family pseudouridine synthase [Chlorobiota bacterium]
MIDEKQREEWLERIEAEEQKRPAKQRSLYSLLYKDEAILVFNKAAGIATIPERHDDRKSLRALAAKEFGRLWTVHRIDKDTSGVVLFARNPEAHRLLNEQFRERKTEKKYLAVVQGMMSEEEMHVDIPLATDPGRSGKIRPSADGKESVTILRRLELFQGFMLIEAQPLTGRQHQIRVHCRAVGLPLLVDRLYGGREAFYLSSIKRKYRKSGREERPLIDRHTLHATSLTVVHPVENNPCTFEAEVPKDFRALLRQLRKFRGLPSDT